MVVVERLTVVVVMAVSGATTIVAGATAVVVVSGATVVVIGAPVVVVGATVVVVVASVVVTAATQASLTIVFAFSVTAALRARSCPLIVAPLFAVILVNA